MENQHNCILLLNNYSPRIVDESSIVQFLTIKAKAATEIRNLLYDEKINLKPIDILDARRGLTTRLNYCPFCGKKIDWKKIKDNIREI
jgi:hypothetical protein